jgi:hypothetical protein
MQPGRAVESNARTGVRVPQDLSAVFLRHSTTLPAVAAGGPVTATPIACRTGNRHIRRKSDQNWHCGTFASVVGLCHRVAVKY